MSSTPLYKEIAKSIKSKILDGTYAYQSMLPSENSLANHYHVSRVTIRLALEELLSGKYISKMKGKGSVVCTDQLHVLNEKATKIISFSQEMKHLNKQVETKVLTYEIIPAEVMIAKALGIKAGGPTLHYVRVRYVDNVPYLVEEAWLDGIQYGDLSYTDLLHSKFEYFDHKKNLQVAFSHQVVHAKIVDKVISSQLNIEKNIPVINILQTTYLDNGKILEYSSTIFTSNHYAPSFIKMR